MAMSPPTEMLYAITWRPIVRKNVPCGAEVSLGLIVATSNDGFASAGMAGSGSGPGDWDAVGAVD